MTTTAVSDVMLNPVPLWQLDDDDAGRYDGLLRNDPLPEGVDR